MWLEPCLEITVVHLYVCRESCSERRGMLIFSFLISILQGILAIRIENPNVEQVRLLQLIVLYSKEWREGVFTFKVKRCWGKPAVWAQCRVWLRAVAATALPMAATGRDHPLSEEETNRSIFSNPSNIAVSVNNAAFISLGVKSVTFFCIFWFSAISLLLSREIFPVHSYAEINPLFLRRAWVLEVLVLLGVFFSLVICNLYFSLKRHIS